MKTGRKAHQPTKKTRDRVTAWSGGGIEQAMIAASLPDPTPDKPNKIGISIMTLVKHYSQELAIGKTMMDGLAIGALANAMQGGGKEAVRAADIWTSKRMGWKAPATEVSGLGGAPVALQIITGVPRSLEPRIVDTAEPD